MSRVVWRGDEFIKRFQKVVDDAATVGAAVAARAAEQNIDNSLGGESSAPGGYPATDTGRLRNSIAFVRPEVLGTPGVAAFGTNVVYGRVLENGAIINAKGKKLTVPLNREAKLMRRRNANLRTEPGLFFIRLVSGAYLAKRVGDTARLMFKLVDLVFVAARPWAMRSALEARQEIFARMKSTLQAGLKQMGGA